MNHELRIRNKKKARKKSPHYSLSIIPNSIISNFIISNSSPGFTLIEILIVVTIVAIAAVVGIMNLSSYRTYSDLNHASQEIVTFLRDAQSRSVSQESGSRWGVHFENPASGSGFYEMFTGTGYSTTTVVAKAILPSSVKFDIPASGSSSTVIFSPVTGLPNASTTIKISTVSNAAVSSTVTINSNGQIQY